MPYGAYDVRTDIQRVYNCLHSRRLFDASMRNAADLRRQHRMHMWQNSCSRRGMSSLSDITRRQALIELLATKDPFDAQRRHQVVIEGRPDRHDQVLRLASVYIQAKLLEMRAANMPHRRH